MRVFQADREFGPHCQRVASQNLICQHIRKRRCQDMRKLRPHVVEFQQVIRRPLKGLINDAFRPNGGSEKTRCDIRHGLRAVDIGTFARHRR